MGMEIRKNVVKLKKRINLKIFKFLGGLSPLLEFALYICTAG
jgi:hypothetical protein